MSYSPMELAEVFIKTGELNDALDALNKHIEEKPSDNEARRLRVSVLSRFDKPAYLQSALDDLNQITDQSPDDLVQLSVIHERMNQTEQALDAMQKAHQIAPDDERILERLVELLTREQRLNDILTILKNAPQTWRWLMRQAEILALNSNYEDALTALDQAQSHLETVFPDLLSPVSRNTMAQIHIARGQSHLKLNNLKTAEVEFKNALYHIPNDATILFNLGLIYARKGKLSRAENYCKKALKNASDYIRETLIDVLNSDEVYGDLKDKLGV